MIFTCDIQKVDFFIDQIEEKGQVSLDQAIDIFQKFPFNDQFKEARERELTSCLPTVSFKSEDGKALGIWAENDKGFFLHYDNGKKVSDFFLSNEFEQNPQGLKVEEFIELFFKEKIEDELNLTDKVLGEENEEQVNPITFSFADTKKFKYFLWTLPGMALALFLLKIDSENNFELGWGVHLLLSIFWLPSTIVHVSYWFKNRDAVVIIDTKEKTLTYEKNGQQIKFNRADIYYCEINETRSFEAPWNDYRYIWFILKDKRQIVITNFITDPQNIVSLLNLNFKIDRRTIPFLPL